MAGIVFQMCSALSRAPQDNRTAIGRGILKVSPVLRLSLNMGRAYFEGMSIETISESLTDKTGSADFQYLPSTVVWNVTVQ